MSDRARFAPKKFVNLHSHDGFSFYDGMGLPKQHFDFVIKNSREELEIPAMAITNHGNMNSFCHAWLSARDLSKAGQKFKFIPGVELYVHPDLEQWKRDKAAADDNEDEQHGSTVENEEETKSAKHFNPVKRRHHLVVLPKNGTALEHLFATVSRGYLEGFYKFPRVDYKMLKQFKGDFIASSACIGGPLAFAVFSCFPGIAFDDLVPSLLDDSATMQRALTECENVLDQLVDAVGQENFFLELQFNKLNCQHLVNRCLIELSKKTGMRLTATADSHYYDPSVWREREIYKKLGWLNYTDYNPDSLPKSVDDLKAELYPKNAAQMWEAYQQTGDQYGFYDDEVVAQAIENSYHIAFDLIGDVQPDTSVKLPSWSVPQGRTADEVLLEKCREAMSDKGLEGNEIYEQRLKYELSVITEKKFSQYFLVMKLIIDTASDQMLLGTGRGSAAGSLVNYLLGITQVDPMKYGLIFERFINPLRAEYPDIDSDFADRDKLIQLLKEKLGELNVLPISNYNAFQLKSLTKDVSRFFHRDENDGLSFQDVNKVLTSLDEEVRRKVLKQGDDKNLFELKLDDCLQHSPAFKQFMDEHPEVLAPLKTLLHENKALGKHAAGVIISERIPERMPVIKSRGNPQTPWVEGMHYKHLNELGFIKYDLLGLETLRIIERCVNLILKHFAGKKLTLTLEDGSSIECFENDKILLSDGTLKRASDLTDEDDITEPVKITAGYALHKM